MEEVEDLADRLPRSSSTMKYEILDTVVLARDLPDHSLKAGDLGAIVELYGTDASRLSS